MKKLFIALSIASLIFAGTAFADGHENNGRHHGQQNAPIVLTDTITVVNTETDIDYSSCSFIGGGYAAGGQLQLPIQVAYFDDDRTVLGQGGIQVQGAMINGGASASAEQRFSNTMEFEGLTMRQSAVQSSEMTGVPMSGSHSETHISTETTSFNASHQHLANDYRN